MWLHFTKNKILFLIFLVLSFGAIAEEVITLGYLERAPYYYTEDGKAKGFMYERTVKVLQDAKIKYKEESFPANRILQILKDNKIPIITPGWIKNEERLVFAAFSVPIYQNKSQILLVRKNSEGKFKKFGTFKELSQDKKLKLGIIDGWSYGEFFAGIISEMPPQNISKNVVKTEQLVKMLALGRFDYIIVEAEEKDMMMSMLGSEMLKITYIEYPDIPLGLNKHLMISRNISQSTLKKIDESIEKLYPDVRKKLKK